VWFPFKSYPGSRDLQKKEIETLVSNVSLNKIKNKRTSKDTFEVLRPEVTQEVTRPAKESKTKR
jgi:hypothetical protein